MKKTNFSLLSILPLFLALTFSNTKALGQNATTTSEEKEAYATYLALYKEKLDTLADLLLKDTNSYEIGSDSTKSISKFSELGVEIHAYKKEKEYPDGFFRKSRIEIFCIKGGINMLENGIYNPQAIDQIIKKLNANS